MLKRTSLLQAFSPLRQLQQLWISGNRLSAVPAGLPASLQRLLLDFNRIENLTDVFPADSQVPYNIAITEIVRIKFYIFVRLDDIVVLYLKQAVVLKRNKPRPRVAHRGISRFLGIDQKCNRVVPWSVHSFTENFTQIGPAVFS